jgi:hypothetical protein
VIPDEHDTGGERRATYAFRAGDEIRARELGVTAAAETIVEMGFGTPVTVFR